VRQKPAHSLRESDKKGGLRILTGGLIAGILMALLTIGGADLLAAFGLQGANVGEPAIPTPVPDLVRVGEPPPDFSTTTPDGEPIALRDHRGSVVALNFWATWCVPCRTEMPALQRASETFTSGELVIVGINAGESPQQVREFLDEYGLTFPIALDQNGSIADLYGVRVFPTTIWIDAQGNVQAEHYGPLTENQIEGYVTELSIGS
jgi:peroxiredoxin